MKLIRFIYPVSGKVTIQEKNFPLTARKNYSATPGNNRIEIYNAHGNLVCITNDRKNIGLLKLQKGFYLLREKDTAGRIVNSRKLEF
ncbi:MAG: T9SS type A sorting domain-containing protein [Bacteroidales bacterium]